MKQGVNMGEMYKITPLAKPRMTQRDRWKQRPCVLRYHAFKDEVRNAGLMLPDAPQIAFVIPMPKSWSKAKRARMDGQPHQQRPDIDNLIKGLLDAVFVEDCEVWAVYAEKRWGQVGSIEILDSN